MVTQPSYKPLADLVDYLEDLHHERKTGRLSMTTPDNCAASFTLVNGDIVDVHYRTSRGLDALNAVESLHWVSFQFSSGNFSLVDALPLPHTAIILHRLENALEELEVLPSL